MSLLREQHKKLIEEMMSLGNVICQNETYLAVGVAFSARRRTKLPKALHLAILYLNSHKLKQCNLCKKDKPRSLFAWHCFMPDGLSLQCRDCKNETLRLQAQKKRNRKVRYRFTLSQKCKQIVMSRDNNECLLCSGKEHLQIHHIIPVKILPALQEEMRNLATICKQCHYSKVHPTTKTYDTTVARFLIQKTKLNEVFSL